MKLNNVEVPQVDDELCENMKPVLSKYGQTVVCDDDEVDEKATANLVLPGGEGCETAKTVASKYGYKVVCEDEEK